MKPAKFRRTQSVPDVYNRIINVLVLGGAGVGKSSLVRRLLDKEFLEEYIPTVYDVYHKEIVNDNGKVTFQITDMSGYYSFPPMRRLAISKSNVFVLVYEIGNKKSYNEIVRLKGEIVQLRAASNISIIVVGNKADIVRPGSTKDVEMEDDLIASSFTSLRVSAKTNSMVFRLFQSIIDASDHLSSAGMRRREYADRKTRSLKTRSIIW